MDEKRLKGLFSNQKFVDTLGSANKAEEVVRLLAENGIELNTEDAEAFLTARNKASEGELSEDALDDVAGGIGGFGLAVTGAKVLWYMWKKYRRYTWIM